MNVNSVGKANLERQSVERPSALASVRNHIGLRGIAAVLPPRTRDLQDLRRNGLLVSDFEALKELGFEKVHVCDPEHNVGWLTPPPLRYPSHLVCPPEPFAFPKDKPNASLPLRFFQSARTHPKCVGLFGLPSGFTRPSYERM